MLHGSSGDEAKDAEFLDGVVSHGSGVYGAKDVIIQSFIRLIA